MSPALILHGGWSALSMPLQGCSIGDIGEGDAGSKRRKDVLLGPRDGNVVDVAGPEFHLRDTGRRRQLDNHLNTVAGSDSRIRTHCVVVVAWGSGVIKHVARGVGHVIRAGEVGGEVRPGAPVHLLERHNLEPCEHRVALLQNHLLQNRTGTPSLRCKRDLHELDRGRLPSGLAGGPSVGLLPQQHAAVQRAMHLHAAAAGVLKGASAAPSEGGARGGGGRGGVQLRPGQVAWCMSLAGLSAEPRRQAQPGVLRIVPRPAVTEAIRPHAPGPALALTIVPGPLGHEPPVLRRRARRGLVQHRLIRSDVLHGAAGAGEVGEAEGVDVGAQVLQGGILLGVAVAHGVAVAIGSDQAIVVKRDIKNGPRS
mmetsp:Transcript_25600/g.56341  ORF Transcript_25600/g.56341 Transcript_25600/m.56341 type:complete len:367 (+) Transcript_25600:866-1966(+)